MLISEYIKNAISSLLSNEIDERESQTLLRFLIEDTLKINRIDFSTYYLNPKEIEGLNEKIKRLQKNEPLQYITQKAFFYGVELEVSPAVLIPRPETEELVHQFIKDFELVKTQKNTILEVGTGSGCISIALAKYFPAFHFIAMDISKEALEIAKKNAKTNKIDNIDFLEVDFLKLDVLKLYSNYPILQRVNHVISNPPYIRESEKKEMSKNVLDFEPNLALFVEDSNALIFYEALARFCLEVIKNKNGLLYVEINQYLATQTKVLFERFDFRNCTIFKDLQENERFIRASYEQYT